jgi:RNA polymerase sporulation-specific sigma factor
VVKIEEAQANKKLMDIFINENMGLVGTAIKKLHIPSTEDYVQEGAIGLIKAARRFDSSFGVTFSTYAIPMIVGELRRHMRDYGTTVKVPRDIKSLFYKSLRLDHLTDDEICKELNITIEELNDARLAMNACKSLDEDVHKNDSGDAPIALHDILASDCDIESDVVENMLQKDIIERLFQHLNDEHAEILHLSLLGKSQMQIKYLVGLSQAQVSRILRGIIEKGKQIAEGGIKLKITKEQLLNECREYGTGKAAWEFIAKKYGMTPGSVSNCISNHKICKILKAEKEKSTSAPVEINVKPPVQIVEPVQPDIVQVKQEAKPAIQHEEKRNSTLKVKAWDGKENTYSFRDGKLIITNEEGTLTVADIKTMIQELQELADKEAV